MKYTIGELAKQLGINEHTLRYYEKEHLIEADRVNNIRKYSDEDKKWLEFLLHLKRSGMSICDLKEFANPDLTNQALLETRIHYLEKQKENIREERQKLLEHYQFLSLKLDDYQEQLYLLEKETVSSTY